MISEIDELIEKWLDGSLAEERQDVLLKWLEEHPENMLQFVRANVDEQLFRDAARGEFVAENVQEKVPRTTESAASGTVRTIAWIGGLAACVLVAAFILPRLRGVAEIDDPSRPVTFLSVGMVQIADSEIFVGKRLGAETIEIPEGVVRLLFDDGVEVALQGPARYELLAPGLTRLHAGLLTATVPEGAEGFRVDTPSAQVVDLGTVFGIEQRDDGTSLVSVFDGEVEVAAGIPSDKRRLTEGQAISLDPNGPVQAADFSVRPFEKLWPAVSGIAGSTGSFELAPPWPRMLRRVESDSNIFVVPEGYARVLNQACPVDVAVDKADTSTLPAGIRVRSFLLQFNPVDVDPQGIARGQRNGRRIRGSITFDRPVVGLITATETLAETDVRFGLNRAGAMRGRGLEMRPPRIADVLTLSDDRQTLYLDLFVVNRLSDHVRVIVDASLHDHATTDVATSTDKVK